jgi:hypothetical protein
VAGGLGTGAADLGAGAGAGAGLVNFLGSVVAAAAFGAVTTGLDVAGAALPRFQTFLTRVFADEKKPKRGLGARKQEDQLRGLVFHRKN